MDEETGEFFPNFNLREIYLGCRKDCVNFIVGCDIYGKDKILLY